MNQSNVFSLPVAANAVFDEYLRVKVDSSGNAALAGALDRGIGHLAQPVNGPEGRLVADIIKNSAVSTQFAHVTAAVAKGQRVIAAADGKVAPLLNGVMKDNDSAASAGVAVKIAPLQNGVGAFLNAANAGNADAIACVGNGGPRLNVDDNDSPAGVALYFDEDGVATGEGKFLCVSPTGADLLVPVTSGHAIRVFHDADAATKGVAVYFDDDAANNYERLLFVSPTNANGAFQLDEATDNISLAVATEAATASSDIIRIAYR
jgi:hypothetical protein